MSLSAKLQNWKSVYFETINSKVIGKIEPCHDVFGHHYKFTDSGLVVDSVTTKNILDKPHLVPWAAGLAIEYLETNERFHLLKTEQRETIITAAKFQYRDARDLAGGIGGRAHEIIEEYVLDWMKNGQPMDDIRKLCRSDENYRAVAAARAAEKVLKDSNVYPIASEIIVGDPKVGAGTLDLLVMDANGKLELWDWKTSNSVDDFYAMQVAAYKTFFEKMTGFKIARCKIMKLDKFSDRFTSYVIPDPKSAYKAFKHVSAVHDWLNNKKDKLITDKNRLKI